MSPADVVFPLAVYERHGIEFKQARAVELHPEGRADDPAPYLVAESTRPSQEGVSEDIPYDFLIAGAFVAASVLLGIYVNPLFHWFTLFVGLNLLQSAFTQWCLWSAIIASAPIFRS